MAEPMHAVVEQERVAAARRRAQWRRLTAPVLAVWVRLTRPARVLPGVAAVGCAFAGSLILWGVGVALLVAVPFLLALDARTPRL